MYKSLWLAAIGLMIAAVAVQASDQPKRKPIVPPGTHALRRLLVGRPL